MLPQEVPSLSHLPCRRPCLPACSCTAVQEAGLLRTNAAADVASPLSAATSGDDSADPEGEMDDLGFPLGQIPPLTSTEKKEIGEMYMSPVFRVRLGCLKYV